MKRIRAWRETPLGYSYGSSLVGLLVGAGVARLLDLNGAVFVIVWLTVGVVVAVGCTIAYARIRRRGPRT